MGISFSAGIWTVRYFSFFRKKFVYILIEEETGMASEEDNKRKTIGFA